MQSRLALDMSAQRSTVKKSAISHPQAGLGMYALGQLPEKDGGVLLWLSYLCKPSQGVSQDEDLSKGSGVNDCQNNLEMVNELPAKKIDKDEIQHKMWIASKPFYGM